VTVLISDKSDLMGRNDLIRRRQEHYALFKAGLTIDEIAARSGSPASTVDVDITHVRTNGGFEQSIGKLGRVALFVESWADLETVKTEAWKSWARSKEDQVIRRKKSGGKGESEWWEESEEVRTTPGDPRYLSAVSDALYRQMVLAGFVSDGQGGRAPVGAADGEDMEDDTVAIVEVADREQAAAVNGKRFCRLGTVDGEVVGRPGAAVDEGEAGEAS
jgi:hypothetical protein